MLIAMAESTRARGDAVEQKIAEHLEAHGLRVLDRNVTRTGAEVDLIALDARLVEPEYVFVEIRSRAHARRGSPLETIDRDKRSRIVRAATTWLIEQDLWERVAVRFDVVGVTGEAHIEWIEHAFDG